MRSSSGGDALWTPAPLYVLFNMVPFVFMAYVVLCCTSPAPALFFGGRGVAVAQLRPLDDNPFCYQ
jgi:hypothetical protein